ncbi:MAG: 2-oxo acid dehydrogenase subunit E2 [Planctomycetes bacterium]|nr:2-oxo acid dehydrogenase subunit E2 [Planctomycetota bacterium]
MPVTDMLMPKMGESIAEATIITWRKKPGDTVKKDEIILEISTDKVDSEVPAPASGVLKEVLFAPDATVEVGKVIARIDTDGKSGGGNGAAAPAKAEAPVGTRGSVSAEAPKAAAQPSKTERAATEGEAKQTAKEQAAAPARPSNGERPAAHGTTPVPRTDGKHFYSPVVRAMAKEQKISLEEISQLEGSGKDGRISRRDLEAYVQTRGEAKPAAKAEGDDKSAGSGEKPTPQAAPATAAPARDAFGNKRTLEQLGLDPKKIEVHKMTTVRKAIVKAMRNTIDTAAHVSQVHEVDLTEIVKFRESVKKRFLNDYGFNLTYTSFFVWAACRALERFPKVNAMINGDEYIVKKFINFGFAVALDSGDLIVPNIKNCQDLNLVGIARAVDDLGNRAKTGNLTPNDTSGGTFTLTNVGSFGPIMGMPLINQPESGIMGAGKIVKRPVMVKDDLWGFRDMVYLSLSFDHRLVDGALAGRFMMAIEDELQNFDTKSTGLERREK